jgi:hypothetical protein
MMKHRPWLKYIHWFGYAASCIVITQLLFLAYLGLEDWKRREHRREQTAMQQGPANSRLDQFFAYEREISLLLNQLPSPSSLAPDGFRIVATPSFGDTNFAISLRHTPQGGEGIMLMTPANSDSKPVQTVRLKLAPAVYTELTARLDALASSWKGDSDWWTDGTGIVFERVKDKSVTSGIGNSPLFYGEVGALVFDAVRPTTPQLARFDRSWRPRHR